MILSENKFFTDEKIPKYDGLEFIVIRLQIFYENLEIVLGEKVSEI